MNKDSFKGRGFSEQKLALLASMLGEEGVPQAPSLKRIPRDGELPLSSAQMRLWLFDQLEPASSAYNIPIQHEFKGHFDLVAFERSVSEIVRRHEALRTSYLKVNGRPVQKINPPQSFLIPVVDLQDLPKATQEQEVARLVSIDARQPYDLGSAPLMRAQVLKLAPDGHVLVLNFHHIAFDWWSVGVFEKELAALYDSFLLGEEASRLPELPLQYVDFAARQRQQLQGEILQEQLDYWQKKLSGTVPLGLPTDRPRPPIQTYNGSFSSSMLSAKLTESLKTLSQREGITLFTTLLAAFKVLLQRYTGQDDIVVGAPIAGRNSAEIEGLIGFFVNTLVMRTDLSDDPTFRQVLRRVQETTLGAYAHQDLPFDKLVEVLNPERNASHSPMFQVMLSMLDTPVQPLHLPGLQHRRMLPPNGASKFDLTLFAIEESGGLSFICEYNTDLFRAGAIERLLGHLEVLLEGVVGDPDRRLSELPLLTPKDRQQLLIGWNDTQVAYPQQLLLDELFEAQVDRTPEAIAVDCDGQQLTYRELNQRSNQLAHQLRGLGVGPDVLVGLCVERSLEMVVGLLGILKAGGAYVPLDPSFPEARLAYMIADSGMGVLVTHRQLDQSLPVRPASIVHLDADWEAIARQDATDAGLRPAQPENLAYVLYTSGSTGKPKGVAIPHAAVVNFLRSMQREPGFGAEDRLLAVTTLSFDIAGLELYLPLVTGGTTVIASREDNYDPARLIGRIRESQCTVMQATPATWRALLEAGWEGSRNLKLLCGGEALPGDLAAALLPRCAQLWNMYGPTETTIWSTVHQVKSVDGPVPIGRPIANTQVFILDGHRQLVPPGIVGELYIGGSGLARGYLARPELTAERFVESPFEPNARLYRTGDRARWRADGTLECLGRVDNQVKIRGFRIEPGEVESALARHPAVAQCVVVAREDSHGDKILAAYLEPRPGQPAPQVSDLRQHLANDLPAYMVPSAFVVLDQLPLTPNGKIDRNALPAPAFDPVGAAHASLAPRTETEQALAAIWSEVLKAGGIGVHDNFFDLGGHSLLVIRAVSRIRDVFEVELLPSSFFAHPTVAGLARVLAEDKSEGGGMSRIERRNQDGPCSLSYAQERLWFLDQLAPGSPVYNIVDVVAFEGSYNAEAMQRAANELVRRHETLRTAFSNREGQPVQVVVPTVDVAFPEVDLRQLPEKEREKTWIRLAQEEGRKPFNLEQPPLLRGTLVRLSEQKQLLLLTVHHIIADEWSMEVLQRELHQLYRAFCQGEPSPLAELPIRYTDFVHWQRGYLQGEVLQKQVGFWKEALAGAPTILELPTDKPRPAVQSFRGAVEAFELPRELLERLKLLSRQQDATLFMTLSAAFMTLLHRYTGQDDILVGTPISGRTRSETEDLIGLFLNLVILRAQFSGEGTFQSLLQQVRQRALGAYGHQDLPFEQLVAELAPERDLSRTPLFQVMFVLFSTEAASQASDAAGLSQLATGTSKFDLTLAVSDTEAGLKGVIEYRTDLFEAETIRRLGRHYGTLLDAISRDPDQTVSTLPILADGERQQLLEEWNNTAVPRPEKDLCLPQMIAEQARKNPEQVALIFQEQQEEQQLTYRELDQRSNQLAHQLRGLGVGPDVLVGLCVERSLEMVVGLLGILKAGGAYVPLDPSFPEARLAYMIADSGMRVLVTHRQLDQSLPVRPASIVHLDADWEAIARQDATDAGLRPAQPENLAYVLYTSGSTGKPKGVAIPHAAVVNFLRSMQREPGFGAEDRLLAVTTLSFDIAGLELYLPLVTGGTTVIASREDNYDPARLIGRIRESQCTVMQATPATWRALLEAGWEGSRNLKLLCGGEALPGDLAAALLPRCAQLWNMYGPTETTIWSTVHQVKSVDGPVPIGRPIANTQVFILDGHRQLVPPGIVGELYIGGSGLARGYLARPELTAERFVESPFEPSARLYRTGDRARWRADGTLECLGRVDNQVKIRGFRIEPGEVESALARHPAVAQCVVVAREDSHGDKILAAYLEPRPGQPAPQVSDLRQHLANDLPAYMVPSAFVVLDQLPLTPNGKIDRNALPAPAFDPVGAAHASLAPRTETEQALAAIWSEVLKAGGIGVHDNFFDLGGHSLLVIRAVSRIRDVFEVELLPSSFFAHPTVAGLARVLAEDKSEGGGMSRIERRNQDGPCSLSYAQERLWFLDQLAPGSPVYNIVDVVAFEGSYNAEAMQRAATELVRRHETLRTAFSSREGQPVQVVVPTVDVAFPERDLRQLPDKERKETWIRLAQEEGQKPFNLAQPPLLRGTLVRLSEQKQLLLLTVHHIIADEWSMEVLQRELHQLYRAFCQGEPSPLAELPIRYTDFVHWQRGYLQGEVLQKQVGFWKEALAGAPTILELPTDKPRPAVQSFRGAVEAFELPRELLERLKLLSRQQDATLFMTLSAAFMTLLHRYTGQDDILVGTPISGRTRSETEDLIGLFLNLVILRAQFSGEGTFQSLLQQVRQRALGAYGHQDLPFEQLVAELAPERDLSRTPLFQVMFVLFSTEAASQASDAAGLSQLATGTSKFDLTLAVSDTEAGLKGVIEYRTDLFEAETIRRLGRHYGTLLDAISRDPEQTVSTLPILADGERQQLLEEWNNTAVPHPEKDLCLPQMIAEQARKNPEQVALIFQEQQEEQQLTYRELDQRSNQLAHQLRGLGVGPDVLVGLCVERSLEMVVGLLGILKAGGAYVPLDPSFPEARLAYMIADSGMRVLVTHRQLDQSLPVRPASIVYLDADWEAIARQDATDAGLRPAQPENLAYVLYTSGSTGKPKGVAIPHAAVVNFLRSMQREPGFGAEDRLLAVTTLSFDIAGLELYLPLVTGGTTVIASREDNYDPARLIGRIRESQCTVMQATPATWRALLEAGWEGSRNLKLLCGGEALPGDLAQALLPRCAQLWNMYGPTETTIWSTVHQVTSVDGPVPIGRPIANTQVFILDGHRQLVPPGIVGELYIGGSGLARGYLARPELTAERFVESPFEPSARLYRTGDRARWRADGTLECLGRVDNQVKIRGFRIEPGEVESALARHPAVAQCVVVAREDSHGDKILAAYLEPRPGQPAPQVSDLRAHLANDLPAYMVPSAFVILDQLPLTPNGKIDRNALPTPNQEHIEVSGEVTAPRDAIEQMLVQIWSRVLHVRSIGIHDNFFDLGGHSLLAVRIVAEIEGLVKKRLPLATFLQAPTIADLADVLRREDWKPSWSSLTPIRAGGSRPPLFLMHSHGGNVLEYYPLAKYLEADQPVYALQARGLDGNIIKNQSFEAMAAAHLAELRSLQPQGPYFLGGYCLGGLLALEAAQQLSAAGEEVASVILIQSTNPAYARFRPDLTLFQRGWYRTTKRVGLELEYLRNRGANYFLDRCRRTWDIARARTAIAFDNSTGNGHEQHKHRSLAYTLEMLAIEHEKARIRYTPRSYNGPVILFRASKQLSGLMTDYTLGWKDLLTGSLEICEVPGRQETMLSDPNVSHLAEKLTAQLHAAQDSCLTAQLAVDSIDSVR